MGPRGRFQEGQTHLTAITHALNALGVAQGNYNRITVIYKSKILLSLDAVSNVLQPFVLETGGNNDVNDPLQCPRTLFRKKRNIVTVHVVLKTQCDVKFISSFVSAKWPLKTLNNLLLSNIFILNV